MSHEGVYHKKSFPSASELMSAQLAVPVSPFWSALFAFRGANPPHSYLSLQGREDGVLNPPTPPLQKGELGESTSPLRGMPFDKLRANGKTPIFKVMKLCCRPLNHMAIGHKPFCRTSIFAAFPGWEKIKRAS